MLREQKATHRLKVRGLIVFLVALLSLVCRSQAQATDSRLSSSSSQSSVSLPDAISRVSSGKVLVPDLELIAEAKAVEEVPTLESAFKATQDPKVKEKIASTLVRLGDRDVSYWSFLVDKVNTILGSDAPDSISYDEQGREAGISPEFVAWSQSHGLTLQVAIVDQTLVYPGTILELGLTGDKRAIPLLRRSLLSPNRLVQHAAALGLAEFNDKDSIPLIVEACRRSPAKVAEELATSLIFFDDPEAKSQVEKYVPANVASIIRTAHAAGYSPLGQRQVERQQ
jgi:HEAT repeat protein